MVLTDLPEGYQEFRAKWYEHYAFGYASGRDYPFLAVLRRDDGTDNDIAARTFGEFREAVEADAQARKLTP